VEGRVASSSETCANRRALFCSVTRSSPTPTPGELNSAERNNPIRRLSYGMVVELYRAETGKPLPFLPLRGSGFWRGEKKSIYSSIHPSLPSHLPFSPYIQSCKPPTGEGSAQTPKIRESPDRKGGIEIEFSRVSTAWEKTQGSPFPGLIPLPSGSSRPAEPLLGIP